jgi:hypothetical protein
MNLFQRLKSLLTYREAIRKADRAHAKDGRRYYVLPSAEGKLLIMDRENFRILKHKHYIDHRARVQDLLDECFYCTPYRYGDGVLTPEHLKLKKQQYLSWCRAYHHLKSSKRKKAR